MSKNIKQNKIRNFSIIAHIDHGKSTLADRLMEISGTVEKRKVSKRMLDTLELEQERGITIKLQTVRMNWSVNHQPYILNLIDTPGHVDFAYEVSRSLAACEGAVLLVDATQGIEAQTISTVFQAMENDLEIIPVINKIDLPNADVDKVKFEMIEMFGFAETDFVMTSGKTGVGAKELLDKIVEIVPVPTGNSHSDTKALIFDSFYDEHKGVMALVRIFDGEISKVTNSFPELRCVGTKTVFEPIKFGYLTPEPKSNETLFVGEVGYIATGLKDIKEVRVGDTITLQQQFNSEFRPLTGYKQPLPMVYAGIFPLSTDEFEPFREALEKLALNDASLTFTPEVSSALGPGFRCGFLGLLHMEIVKERLSREFDIEALMTVPGVRYEVNLTSGDIITIKSPQDLPEPSKILEIKEPWATTEIVTPENYIGPIMQLCQDKRGIYKNTEYINQKSLDGELTRAILRYEIPIAEIITDFFDKLKSISRGYASLDYKFKEFQVGEIVKVDILVNNEVVPPLSFLTHKDKSVTRGKGTVEVLKEIIPRQQFKIPIQAAIGSNIIARADISALRKDVTAKLYGGDVTRKRKLLEKQKVGKKRLRKFGKVELPQEAFLAAMKQE